MERWAGKLPTCESRIDPIVRLPIQISILHPPRLNTTPYGLEAGAHAELLEQSLRQILFPGSSERFSIQSIPFVLEFRTD
ncbi:hypothetical protein SDJN03_18661, partial [Cucurbita argyrosperma subsp. sororia]